MFFQEITKNVKKKLKKHIKKQKIYVFSGEGGHKIQGTPF